MLRIAKCLAVASMLLAAPSFGADLPSRLPPPQPPIIVPAPVFTWTGFYVGGNVGGGGLSKDVVGIHYKPGNVFVGNFGTMKPSGVFGGGQAGYNYQWGRVVVGAEADIQASGVGDKATVGLAPLVPGSVTTSSRTDYFGSARIRLGYAFDRVLVYATGGLGYGDVKYNLNAGTPASLNSAIKDQSIHIGDALGAGIEYAFTNHWSIKLEYQHMGLGGKTAAGQVFAKAASTKFSIYTKESPEFETARLGINYRF